MRRYMDKQLSGEMAFDHSVDINSERFLCCMRTHYSAGCDVLLLVSLAIVEDAVLFV